MNLFWILFAGFQFLELTEETVQLKALPQDSYESPIALIRNQGSTRLQLATPVEYETGKYWNRAIYAYNDSADEHGPAEEFRTACPLSIYTSQESEKRIEREWRAKNQPSEYGSLFFVDEVDWMYDLHCDGCSIKPSIQRITNEEGSVESCGLSAAEMWGVGFPIADKKQKNHFAYQFVSDDDMPTKNLHRTTFFRFNYFPIPKHKSILRSMIRADNYIRLYSKETKKPLTIYSGRSQKTILRKPYHCAPEFICKPVPFEIDFFWRIIKDEQNNAIILVTQLTQVLCNEKTYICHKNRDVLQSYWWHGGCIYTCSVDKDIIELLQLPQGQLKNTGTLDVSFAKKIETETTESPQSSPKSSNAKSPAKVTMQDFMSKKTFMLALLAYDASLAETVVDHNPPQSSGFFDILSGSGGHGGGGAWFDGGGGGDVGGHAGGDDGGGAGASD